MSGLVQADDRLRECVIVRIPNRADRRLDTGLGVRTPPRPPYLTAIVARPRSA